MHLSFLQLRRDATWPSSRLRGARRAAQPYRIADCVAAGLVSSSAKRCILLKSLNPDSKPKASGQAAAAMRMPAAMGLRAAAAKVFEKKKDCPSFEECLSNHLTNSIPTAAQQDPASSFPLLQGPRSAKPSIVLSSSYYRNQVTSRRLLSVLAGPSTASHGSYWSLLVTAIR